MSPPRCIAVIQGTTLSGFRAQTTVGPRREPNLLRGQSEMRRRSLETWRLMLSLFFLVSAAASFFKGEGGDSFFWFLIMRKCPLPKQSHQCQVVRMSELLFGTFCTKFNHTRTKIHHRRGGAPSIAADRPESWADRTLYYLYRCQSLFYLTFIEPRRSLEI